MKNRFSKKINSSFLAIGIFTLAVFIISFTAFYSQENFSSTCGCKLSPWVVVVSISSFGIFVGSILYYAINSNLLREKNLLEEGVKKIGLLFEEDDRKIIGEIIQNGGKIYQSRLCSNLSIDKVRCSRAVSKLEERKIISRKKEGMTNLLELDEELYFFLKNTGFKN